MRSIIVAELRDLTAGEIITFGAELKLLLHGADSHPAVRTEDGGEVCFAAPASQVIGVSSPFPGHLPDAFKVTQFVGNTYGACTTVKATVRIVSYFHLTRFLMTIGFHLYYPENTFSCQTAS